MNKQSLTFWYLAPHAIWAEARLTHSQETDEHFWWITGLGKKSPPENSDGRKKPAAQTSATMCTAAGHLTWSLASLAKGFLIWNRVEKSLLPHTQQILPGKYSCLWLDKLFDLKDQLNERTESNVIINSCLLPSEQIYTFKCRLQTSPHQSLRRKGHYHDARLSLFTSKLRQKAVWGPCSHRQLVLLPHLAPQISYASRACCAHSRNPLHIHLCSKPAF